MTFRCL